MTEEIITKEITDYLKIHFDSFAIAASKDGKLSCSISVKDKKASKPILQSLLKTFNTGFVEMLKKAGYSWYRKDIMEFDAGRK